MQTHKSLPKRASQKKSNETADRVDIPNSKANCPSFHDLYQPLTAINNYICAGRLLIKNAPTELEQLNSVFEKIGIQSLRAIQICKEMDKNE